MAIIDSTQRFSSRVDNYVRYRPGYPSNILDVLKSECRLNSHSVVADIGSGTGFLSRLFLDNGNQVYGVEPNFEMRAAGERLLQPYSKFTSLNGTAETTGLPGSSVDFVTAGQAAHWFDRQRARLEFIRILKAGGWAMLVWNDRATDSTPFLREYKQLLENYGVDYSEVRRAAVATQEAIEAFFAPARIQAKTFANQQIFDFEGIKGRLLSSSYAPEESHPKHQPMLNELWRLFDRYQQNGHVVMEYETRMYYGQLSF